MDEVTLVLEAAAASCLHIGVGHQTGSDDLAGHGPSTSLETCPVMLLGSWADEVEAEEKRLRIEELIAAAISSNLSQPGTRGKTKKKSRNAKKARKEEYLQEQRENKLFFGGIIFADLEKRFQLLQLAGRESLIIENAEDATFDCCSSELLPASAGSQNGNDSNDGGSTTRGQHSRSIVELPCDETMLKEWKEARKRCFLELVTQVGDVIRVKPSWDKRYCHVVYSSKASALSAFQVFSCSEERKKRIELQKDELRRAGLKPDFVAPLHNFYVRWPRNDSSSSASKRARKTKDNNNKRQSNLNNDPQENNQTSNASENHLEDLQNDHSQQQRMRATSVHTQGTLSSHHLITVQIST